MSKTNKHWYERAKTTPIIEKIERLAKHAESEVHRRDCRSYLDYYLRNGFLTASMKDRGRDLVRLHPWLFKEKKRSEKRRPYYVYAISNGRQIKVGYTYDVKQRLKRLQTGSSDALSIEWYKLCGYVESEARGEEKKLHRRLKALSTRGEWFSMKALPICKSWQVRHMDKKKERNAKHEEKQGIEQDLDVQLMSDMNKFI